MSKQSLLLVDGDTRSLRVLEVSLRKAGFMVTAALSVQDALDKLGLHVPELIISETTFPDGDGFELRSRVRATPEWAEIPFIFLTAEAAIENKIRGLELGVDDYLTKPIYIKEIVTRINILLQKRQRVRFEERRDGRTRFAGRVQDMPVVDVIQTIEISRKSGVIQFVGERGRQAAIYFRDGRVIDAEAGSLQGEDAVYRLLTWGEGEFEVVFRTVRRREVITMSSQALLMEGMRRLDEWSRLFEQLPPLTHRFEVDTIELAARLGDVPDDNNRILRLVDGKRTLLEVIDASDVGDLECLQAIARLYFEELLIDLDHGKVPRRDTGKSVPLVEIEGPVTVSEDASGPPPEDAAAAPASSPTREPEGSPGERAPEAAAAAGSEVTAEAPPEAEGEGDPEAVGPLMGGFRPSSLRLIDEAVAAAQAIEPSLLDDAAEAHPRGDGHAGNGVSQTALAAGAPASAAAGAAAPGVAAALLRGAEPPGGAVERRGLDAAPSVRAPEREDSGLRMIGSLGRDRAEASGELATLGESRPIRSATARELVTILPRRITRELPILTREPAGSSPTSPAPRSAPAVDPLSPAGPSPRSAPPGSGVRAPSRSRRLLRVVRGGGPGWGPLVLIVLAAALAGTAVLLRLRRHAPPSQSSVTVHDAAGPSGTETPGSAVGPSGTETPGSAAGPSGTETSGSAAGPSGTETSGSAAGPSGTETSGSAVGPSGTETSGSAVGPSGTETPGNAAGPGGEAVVMPGEARGAASPLVVDRLGGDAGTGSPEVGAGGAHGGTVDAGGAALGLDRGQSRTADAKALCDQAGDALDEGEFARAYDLAVASLKLRKTARAYVLRARAEQRLGRVDDALRSLDAATEITPGLGAVWEQRGRILWAARRRDEARTAFARFLELDPNSPRAAEVLRLLNEPR